MRLRFLAPSAGINLKMQIIAIFLSLGTEAMVQLLLELEIPKL